MCLPDIGLLPLLGPAHEEDDQLISLLGDVEAVSRPQSIRYSPSPPPIHLTFDWLPSSMRTMAVATLAAA